MPFFKISNLPPVLAPVCPNITGTGTRKPDADIGQRRWPGTLQGMHRRSEGQGKCCRDSLCNAAW
ncbi:unnamed protein product [Staurois parvus]|uniref:Uncharacterized protein n=1 Tax=Staurois parvus TaxID=386267 RepID=A0ABN9CU68_9NEOB|nr:unnamed protein product [Staurois parvus]